ncbi:YqgE/AlgH family protein [Marinobacter mobilis]|uniref:YqgE/AlgH family protein n=1 Tax=Marinobacter mobilis TaxID=488533 RepID=UPI0035C680E6
MTANRSADNLRDHFLIASPYLADPRFHGSVIYLCEHSSEGALGLVLNRPLDIGLGEILEQLGMDGKELDLPVFLGGPVQPERGFVLHGPGSHWQSTSVISEGVALTTSRDILEDIGRGQGPQDFRVALGYSGWGEGQLEEELASNSWLTCPAKTDLLFATSWQDLYQTVLTDMGIDLNQLSESIGHA